jgi:hypothetical protein
MKIKNKKNGYISLLSVIAISSLAVLVIASVIMIAVDSSLIGSSMLKAKQSQALNDACGEQALLELKKDNDYEGSGSISLSQGECSYTVSSINEDEKIIDVSSSAGNVVSHSQIKTISVYPEITIDYWKKTNGEDEPECECQSWENQGCGENSCASIQMSQARSCSPNECSLEKRCQNDTCSSWSDDSCGASDCEENEMLQTRICSFNCESEEKCIANTCQTKEPYCKDLTEVCKETVCNPHGCGNQTDCDTCLDEAGLCLNDQCKDNQFPGWWKLDENSGKDVYNSTTDNHGYVKRPTWVAGIEKSALYFSNKRASVKVNNHENLSLTTNGSLIAWFKIDQFRTGAGIIHKGNNFKNKDQAYYLILSDTINRLKGGINTGTQISEIESRSTIIPGNWYHVAFTWDNQNMKLYLNGNLDNTINHFSIPRITDGSLQIGSRYNNDKNYYFHGTIDEIIISNQTLNEDKIKEIYDSQKP